MSEARLWEWLRGVLPLGHYSRIETGDTAAGFPDVHYTLDRQSTGTIELKHARRPEAIIPFTEKKGMRQSQILWIRDEVRVGGTVWIIAEIEPRILVIEGKYADKINGCTLSQLIEKAHLVLQKNKPPYAADKLAEILMEHHP